MGSLRRKTSAASSQPSTSSFYEHALPEWEAIRERFTQLYIAEDKACQKSWLRQGTYLFDEAESFIRLRSVQSWTASSLDFLYCEISLRREGKPQVQAVAV